MDRDLQEYIGKIKSAFPIDITSVNVHEGGEDFLILEVNAEWMFRFPRNAISAAAFEREIRFLSRLNPMSPLPTPNYLYQGKGFAGYPKIPGIPLSIELFQSLSVSTQEKLAQQVGSFLSVLHNFPTKDAREIGITQSWDGNHHKNGTVFLEKVAPLLSSPARKNSVLCVESLLAEEFIGRVIHGDLYFPDHVFYNDDKQQLGVIDFADATIYDPAHDFQCILEIGGNDFFESVLKYYQGEDDVNLLKRSKLRLEARPLFYCGYIFASGFEEQYASRVAYIEKIFPKDR